MLINPFIEIIEPYSLDLSRLRRPWVSLLLLATRIRYGVENGLRLGRRLSLRSFFCHEIHIESVEYFHVLQLSKLLGYDFFHDEILDEILELWPLPRLIQYESNYDRFADGHAAIVES